MKAGLIAIFLLLGGCIGQSERTAFVYVENGTEHAVNLTVSVDDVEVWSVEIQPSPDRFALAESEAIRVEGRWVKISVKEGVSGREASERAFLPSEAHIVISVYSDRLVLDVYGEQPQFA